MIFYFTGTGNSKYIADKLSACLDQKSVDMGKAVVDGSFTYDCSEENYIGFIFPTYGYNMPTVVKEFIINMELDNTPDNTYTFAISNCGASEGMSLYELNKLLLNKNINLDYCRNIIFPDNYIILFNAVEDDEQNDILRSANIKLANIINNILRRKKSLYIKKGVMLLVYKLFNYVFVNLMNRTSKFKVNDDCVGCGYCSKICNSNAIKIENDKPVWTKKTCVHCMACISRCPVSAIEFGTRTEGKKRYVNPYAKFDVPDSVINLQNNDAAELESDAVEEPLTVTYTENPQVEEILRQTEESIDIDDSVVEYNSIDLLNDDADSAEMSEDNENNDVETLE